MSRLFGITFVLYVLFFLTLSSATLYSHFHTKEKLLKIVKETRITLKP